MNRKTYRRLRKQIGIQRLAAKRLGVALNTISRRELGLLPITREAALAMKWVAERKR